MTLKQRLGRSTVWMSAAASGNSVVSFLIFIVLSRILTPADIGLVAFALIVVEAGKIIVNAGFPQAIVQRQLWDNIYASTCFYLNMAFALLIASLIFFIGVPLVEMYYEPAAGPILKVLSVIFFIEGAKAVHEGKLKREFAFQVIAIRTVVAGLLSGAVGIYLAIKGFGVWALVWQQLINHSVITLFTLTASRWVPRLAFSREDCKQLLKFSSPLMAAQLIGNISSKIFEVLIGVLVGPAALGFFRVGGRALFILQEIVLKPFEQTVLSALSRIPARDQQAAGTLRVIKISAYLTFPIFFGAAAIGPEFIVFAFGEKWAISGQIMTILALGTAPLVIGFQINAALTASGNSRMVMALASIVFVINCGLGLASVSFGLIAAAYGFAVRSYLTIFFNMYFFRKVFGVNILTVVRSVAASFAASVFMLVSVMGLKLTPISDLPVAVSMIILAAAGGLIYVLLMVTLFRAETRNFFGESIDMVPQKIRPAAIKVQQLLRL